MNGLGAVLFCQSMETLEGGFARETELLVFSSLLVDPRLNSLGHLVALCRAEIANRHTLLLEVLES